MNLLSVENLSKSYGLKTLFEGLTFGLDQGQKAGIVAANGTGKSTLMKAIAGIESPDAGEIVFRKGLTVGYLGQEDDSDPDNNALEEILSGDSPVNNAIRDYERTLAAGAEGPEFEAAMEAMNQLNAWDVESRIKETLGKLGIHDLDKKMGSMSGGQRKRVHLARTLLQNPDILLLDEPTNHLDLPMIEWLQEKLSEQGLTILMITHDRYFLESVVDTIYELDGGKLYKYPGNYSYFVEKKAEREAQQQATIEKAKNLYRTELEWARRMPQGRGTKQKARMTSFHELKKVAKQRIEEANMRPGINTERLGSKIIELHKVSKSRDEKLLMNPFTYHFKRFEKIGLVGRNGCGKSTLLDMVAGKLEPDSGKVVIGDTVKIGYYKQEGLKLDEEKRVIEVIKDIAEFIPLKKGQTLSAAQLLERFLFNRDMHYQYVHTLSGGERKRLFLLTILMRNPNFLILDEPTNDLDIYTLGVLEEYLLEFEGNVIVVSHDRYFLDKMSDHIFAFEGEGVIKDYPGGYTDYRNWKDEQQERSREERSTPTKAPAAESTSAPKESKEERYKERLSYKEKLEFESLEKEIAALEEERDGMNDQMAAGLSADIDQDAFFKKLGEMADQIEEKTLRWMELAERA